MTGIELIAAERERQISGEGYTAERDKNYTYNQLARAGATYALPAQERLFHSGISAPMTWPFSPDSWKPTPGDRKRELAKAGALIAAELDRMLEAEKEAEARSQ